MHFFRVPVICTSSSPRSNVRVIILPLEKQHIPPVSHFAEGKTSKHHSLCLVTMRSGCLPKRKGKEEHDQGKELHEKPSEFLREERKNNLKH